MVEAAGVEIDACFRTRLIVETRRLRAKPKSCVSLLDLHPPATHRKAIRWIAPDIRLYVALEG